MSGGWTPAVHLFSQSRGKLRFDEAQQVFVPGNSVERERSAGACCGTDGLRATLEEGSQAGAGAAEAAGKAGSAQGYHVQVLEGSMVGTPGVLRKIFPAWVAYFLPGFHPWNHDDRALIGKAESEFADAVMA